MRVLDDLEAGAELSGVAFDGDAEKPGRPKTGPYVGRLRSIEGLWSVERHVYFLRVMAGLNRYSLAANRQRAKCTVGDDGVCDADHATLHANFLSERKLPTS